MIVLGCIILLYIVLFVVSSPMIKLRISASKATDLRLKMINELISGIRTIRSYAWENAIMQKIINARNLEINQYMKLLCLRGFVLGLMRYIGLLIFLPLILIKVLTEDGISPGEAYALYGLVLLIGTQSIAVLTIALQAYAEFVAFMRRLGEVLIMEDLELAMGEVMTRDKERVRFE